MSQQKKSEYNLPSYEKLLGELIADAGLTNTEIADRLGYEKTFMTRLRKGQIRKIREATDNLNKVLDELDITYEERIYLQGKAGNILPPILPPLGNIERDLKTIEDSPHFAKHPCYINDYRGGIWGANDAIRIILDYVNEAGKMTKVLEDGLNIIDLTINKKYGVKQKLIEAQTVFKQGLFNLRHTASYYRHEKFWQSLVTRMREQLDDEDFKKFYEGWKEISLVNSLEEVRFVPSDNDPNRGHLKFHSMGENDKQNLAFYIRNTQIKGLGGFFYLVEYIPDDEATRILLEQHAYMNKWEWVWKHRKGGKAILKQYWYHQDEYYE